MGALKEQLRKDPRGWIAQPVVQLVVNSSQGGGSKDTWVVGREQLEGSATTVQGLVEG